jgi:hypothetical protein
MTSSEKTEMLQMVAFFTLIGLAIWGAWEFGEWKIEQIVLDMVKPEALK